MSKKAHYADLKDIDQKTYDWSIRVVRSLTKMLKVNMKLHAEQQIQQGDIFLCNHFSRFETFIPQFLIYQETGEYCCAIASAEFFKQDTVFANYLNSIGVIPHNHQDLFLNLARQVFQGRKIIIFPEGGMVKDHRVIDNQGNYSIYSRISGERRKQHTGAAVLAQGIDAFKVAVRYAYCHKNQQQLTAWQTELKLDSLDQLLTISLKPTLIIPANITFYPIRSSDNFLLKGVEFFSHGLTTRQTEELLIEGNLMFKDTDMDLRMGQPIDPHQIWQGWELSLFNQICYRLNSLSDAFSLYSSGKHLPQKLFAHLFKKNAKLIRNQYMEEIYLNVTVNLSHLASRLIMHCMACGQLKINKQHFYTTLYICIKQLQQHRQIHLHRSLLNPDEYNGLIVGKSQRFEQFIAVAESSELIISTEDDYLFSAKLCEEYDFDTIRMENLIAVYSNEVAPIKVVHDTLVSCYQQSPQISAKQLAEWIFDDEIIALAWDKSCFTKPCYQDINQRETASENPAPFLLKPKIANGAGILLIHGLLASPAELKDYAHHLVDQGYVVFAVRLKGHGTSPYDLRTRTYEDWFKSVQRGLKIISAYCQTVTVIGFSTGGALAFALAAEHPKQVVAVVAVAVPIKLVDKSFLFVPLLHRTNRLVKWVSSIEGVKPFLEHDSEHQTVNYRSVPVKSLYELGRLIDETEKLLPHIIIPSLLVYADEDHVVDKESADILMRQLNHSDKALVMVHADQHGILMDNINHTWEVIDRFLNR